MAINARNYPTGGLPTKNPVYHGLPDRPSRIGCSEEQIETFELNMSYRHNSAGFATIMLVDMCSAMVSKLQGRLSGLLASAWKQLPS